MKINVIIPTYNYARYLETCLMSVFTQRVDCDVEILLSDDNSNDGSLAVAHMMAKNYSTPTITMRVFSHGENLGEIRNTEFLMKQCDGDYVAYLDADDYWIDPYKLRDQLNFMEENREFSMCCTGLLELRDSGFYPERTFPQEVKIAPMFYIVNGIDVITPEVLSEQNPVFASSRFFRNYKGLVKEYFNDFGFSDWPMNFEISTHGPVKYMDKASYVYRIKENSLSTLTLDKLGESHTDKLKSLLEGGKRK